MIVMDQSTGPYHLRWLNAHANNNPNPSPSVAEPQAPSAINLQCMPGSSELLPAGFPVNGWLNQYGIDLGQATSDGSPAFSSDLPGQAPVNAAFLSSGDNLANSNSFQVSFREPADWSPPLVSDPPDIQPSVQPLADPSNKPAPVLQCKWIGCRSSTLFAREGDLIRHLKTVHIAPNAIPCHCGRRFGRKDHLKAHQKTHRQN